MADLRTMQPSFTAGELSPSLWARVDLPKYASGLKSAKNVILHAHGGVSNRPGLEFIGQTSGNNPCRNIPFNYDPDTNQAYILEFTDRRMRVYRAGAPIVEANVAISNIERTAHGTVHAPDHPYANNDEIIISGVTGMTELNGRNVIVKNVETNTFDIQDLHGNWIDTTHFDAYNDGGHCNRIYEIASPFDFSDLKQLTFAQENDVMYFAHRSYAPRKLERLADDDWDFSTVAFAPDIDPPTGLDGVAYFIRKSGKTYTFEYAVTSLDAAGNESVASSAVTQKVQYENEDGTVVHLSWTAPTGGAASYRVYRVDTASDDITGLLVEVTDTFADIGQQFYTGDGHAPPGTPDTGAPPAPTGVSVALHYGATTKYKVSAISTDTGEESLPSSAHSLINDLDFAGNKNTITWDAVDGASEYVVYKLDNGQYGYIGRTETTSFVDENITADLATGPQTAANPFPSSGNYPGCVTFFEQRLCYAGSKRNPGAVWLGQSANYENFGSASPIRASDAITFRIRSRDRIDIKAVVPSRGLGVFAGASEWMVSGGQEDFLTPSNIVVRPQSNRGSADVQPITVGDIMLFAQARGGVIREFFYDFAKDASTGSDITILARHLFEGKEIKSWAYAQSPHSIVWVVMGDGSLLSLTYMREQEVWGWTRHTTSGSFTDVTVVAESEEDIPYFTIKRDVAGQTKYYIERLHSRAFDTVSDAFFVDSGLSYRGDATDTVRGLDHLEGETVVALADGNVVEGLVVSGGMVTLPFSASTIHVGLPYQSVILTLDLEPGSIAGLGTMQGRFKSVSEITLRVQDSRGMWIGYQDDSQDSGTLIELKQRDQEDWDSPIALYTGDIRQTAMPEWTNGGNVCVKQFDPLPMTILAIMPDITFGQ